MLDEYLTRQANLSGYASGVLSRHLKDITPQDKSILSLITDFFNSATPVDLANLMSNAVGGGKVKALYDALNQLFKEQKEAVKVVFSELKELITQEIQFIQQTLELSFAPPPVSEVLKRPILTALSVGALLLTSHEAYQLSLWGTLRKAASEGNANPIALIKGTPDQQYRNGLLQTRYLGLDRDIRTGVFGVTSNASTLAHISAGVSEEIWASTLDGRTTKLCASLDGTVFKVGVGIHPPAHYRCRSRRIPFMRGLESMRPFVESFKSIGDMTKAEKAALYGMGGVGQVSSTTTFEEFFARRPSAFQEEWLGAWRYKQYKAGKLGIHDLVNPVTGREFTIADLKARHNL